MTRSVIATALAGDIAPSVDHPASPPAGDAGPILLARGVVVRYGPRTVLRGVDLELRTGEVLGLLGPNGAGKTTLLRRLAGVIPSRAGTVALDGFDPNTDRSVRGRLGYLPEEPPLYADETARRYVEYRAALSGMLRPRRRTAALAALERAGAIKLAERPVGRLSKGQRQRVGLAAAIVHRPSVLLLDEPTSGLDPRQVADFRETLRGLASSCGVILSTHLLAEAQAVCDRVMILDEGAVVAEHSDALPGGLEEAFFKAVGGRRT